MTLGGRGIRTVRFDLDPGKSATIRVNVRGASLAALRRSSNRLSIRATSRDRMGIAARSSVRSR
jgi:hypothetical protein